MDSGIHVVLEVRHQIATCNGCESRLTERGGDARLVLRESVRQVGAVHFCVDVDLRCGVQCSARPHEIRAIVHISSAFCMRGQDATEHPPLQITQSHTFWIDTASWNWLSGSREARSPGGQRWRPQVSPSARTRQTSLAVA